MTREQFQEMTADLLEKTVEITQRMLADAERRFPGIRGQISELLLVGGSSSMPAVAERLRAEFPWEPKVADPDLAVAKGAALYAAGQTVKLVEAAAETNGSRTGAEAAADGNRRGTLPAGPPSEEAIAVVTERTGMDVEQVAGVVKTVVNVLPKAVGIKLLDSDVPGWEKLPDSEMPFYIEHLVPAQTQLPYDAEKFTAGTTVEGSGSIAIEIWEQAGAVRDQALDSNHRVNNVRPDQGPRAVQAARRVAGRHHPQGGRRGHGEPAGRGADQRQGAHHVREDRDHVRREGGGVQSHRLRAHQEPIGRPARHGVRREGVREVPHSVQP